jgi:hypothetical protein
MYTIDTSVLNIGQEISELRITTTENTGREQYFEVNNSSINPIKTLPSHPDKAMQTGK